jgi:hypothetical protein
MGYMKTLVRAALLCAVLPVLAACASGPTYSELQKTTAPLAANSGRIYIYRSGGPFGAAIQPDVKVDGKVAGAAVPGGYFYVDLSPGSHTISASTEVERDLTVTLEAGQTRYVTLSPSFGAFVGHISPTLVDDKKGLEDIADSHYTGK